MNLGRRRAAFWISFRTSLGVFSLSLVFGAPFHLLPSSPLNPRTAEAASALTEYDLAKGRLQLASYRLQKKEKEKRRLLEAQRQRRSKLKPLEKKRKSYKRKYDRYRNGTKVTERDLKRFEGRLLSAKNKNDKKKVRNLESMKRSLRSELNRFRSKEFKAEWKLLDVEEKIRRLGRFDPKKIKKIEAEIKALNKEIARARADIKKTSARMNAAEKKVLRIKGDINGDLLEVKSLRKDKEENIKRLLKAKRDLASWKKRLRRMPKDEKKEIADTKKVIILRKKEVREHERLLRKTGRRIKMISVRVGMRQRDLDRALWEVSK